jgi:uncharacterized protein YjbI with pentapeptide repeats
MKTLTTITQIMKINLISGENYEVISDETIDNETFKDMVISGALLENTEFSAVTFINCSFYSMKLSGCNFKGCCFQNCKFEFSTISNCNFISTSFVGNHWDISTVQSNSLQYSELDHRAAYAFSKADNKLENCFNEKLPEWHQVLKTA